LLAKKSGNCQDEDCFKTNTETFFLELPRYQNHGLEDYITAVVIADIDVCAVIGGDVEVIHQFRMQIAMIQHAAVGWLHSVVPKLLVIKPSDFMHW